MLVKCFIENIERITTIKNPICFPNISKYTSESLLRKLGDIIKVVGSDLDFIIEEMVHKREREITGLWYIGGYIVH